MINSSIMCSGRLPLRYAAANSSGVKDSHCAPGLGLFLITCRIRENRSHDFLFRSIGNLGVVVFMFVYQMTLGTFGVAYELRSMYGKGRVFVYNS
jgi:hypothetical protein